MTEKVLELGTAPQFNTEDETINEYMERFADWYNNHPLTSKLDRTIIIDIRRY